MIQEEFDDQLKYYFYTILFLSGCSLFLISTICILLKQTTSIPNSNNRYITGHEREISVKHEDIELIVPEPKLETNSQAEPRRNPYHLKFST